MTLSSSMRRWLVMAGLFLLPLGVYWPTVFHRFGLRDDYATINEMRSERAKGFQFFASQGRPIYGLMIEKTFGAVERVEQLAGLRLITVLLFGAVAAGTFLALRALAWDEAMAALVAALIVLLPGAQVVVSWAVCWPHAAALVLTLGAFASAERAMRAESTGARLGLWVAAMGVAAASALTYQAGTQFYVTLVAAGIALRREQAARELAVWIVRHAAVLAVGLAAAFTVTTVTFARGWAERSPRVELETHAWDKLGWFVRVPLERAANLWAVADPRHSLVTWVLALVVGAVVAVSVVGWSRKNGWQPGLRWGVLLVALVPASYGVCLLAAERWASYRTMIALSATVLILLAVALRDLIGTRMTRVLLAVALVGAAGLARWQAFEFFARPQGLELALLEKEAERVELAKQPKVFVVLAGPGDAITPFVYGDEFGSLTMDAEWTVKEMLRLILRRTHPEVATVERSYTFATGSFRPRVPRGDVTIDLRRLRERRTGE